MKEFTVAAVQIASQPNEIMANVRKAIQWIDKAVGLGAELIVFPETFTTGFAPGLSPQQLWDLVDAVPGRSTEPVQEVARRHGVYLVWPTYERGPERGQVFNSAVVIGRHGEILGVYRKTHLFPTERPEAGGWSTAGWEAEVFHTDLATLGVAICYDGDFPDLCTTLALKGAEVIVRPAAFLRTFDHWWATNFARAYDNHVFLVAVNAVGSDAMNNYYFGHSMILGPNGWRLAQGRCAEEIVFARISPELGRFIYGGMTSRQNFDHLEDRNLRVYDVMKPGRSAVRGQLREGPIT